MVSVADPKQIEDSIEIVIEPSAQTDESSQRTLICKELLEAAINGHENNLTQLLGLDVGESPDFDLEARDNALNQAKNLQSRTQETALHCAARYGHSSVISELIDRAQELEHDLKDTLRKKNRHGETALHEAARRGHTATVQTLITEDLELAGLVNKNDESPLYLATVEGHVAVVGLIVEHLCHREITSGYYSGPKRRTALHAAVLRGPAIKYNIIRGRLQPQKEHPDMVNELLKLKSATFAKEGDIFGSTPLHYAASTGDLRILERLLEHDAFLAYCDDSLGLYPLHVAAYRGNRRIIVNLLENNLDSWELLDHRGRNFLHVAPESPWSVIPPLIEEAGKQRKNGHPKLWEVIRKASSARDIEGNTPLDVAARCGGMAAVKALVGKELLIDVSFTSLDNLALSYNSEVQVSKVQLMRIIRQYTSTTKLWKSWGGQEDIPEDGSSSHTL
ncbi:hypothetical protein LUZ61_009337 [Rhynchospora tenuis]|uniref:Ankyrin n=1 Tax=Rhynchospora tenuis TaxID=198213 RepID=A0AAD5ZX20_9POAL|nr:hypothetical protein LUZ61_009337 [Rhynchospora tenuis]